MKRNNKGQFLKGSFVGYVPWNKDIKNYKIKGHPVTEETKKRISETMKKKGIKPKCTKEIREKIGIKLRGIKRSKEFRRKISDSTRGEKGNNWQGGKSKLNHLIRCGIEFRLWREAVFARDNWTCQICKGRNGNGKTFYLHAHHIKHFSDYPELRTSIENGITLCKECHKEIHKKRSVELTTN